MTGLRFDHQTLPQRVRFASSAAAENLRDALTELGAHRFMMIASRGQRAAAEVILADLPVAHWCEEVVMHVPVEVAQRARDAAADHDVDALISIGGGSATGLAKAVALTTGLPIVAVPTTYAGSEVTPVWGMTEAGRKTTGTDPRVLPKTIVYDATLTQRLPVDLSVASGLNALAHSVDALWAPAVNPVNAVLAGEAIRALRVGLSAVVDEPTGLEGREHTLYGAYLSAVAFASAGSGLHHKICHVLGGMFNLPHAPTHAVVLPHVLAFNAPNASAAERRVAAAFDAPNALDGLITLRDALDAPRALRDIGMPADGIAAAADAIVAAAPAGNPTPVTTDTISELLRAAWAGKEPR
jgi:alcohol dehydrogenase class IV